MTGNFNVSGWGYGAGIGCGCGEEGNSSVGSIQIHGGAFRMFTEHAAGIGTGYADFGNSTVDELIISSGQFYIWTDNAAGIGGGYSRGEDGVSMVQKLVITGGNFDIDTAGGAGIGAGSSYWGKAAVGSITITGGSFSMWAFVGSVIGAGSSDHGNSSVRSLTISGGTFDLNCTWQGAGIGGGYASNWGNSSVGTLTISGGSIRSGGTGGAGIGAGRAHQGNSSVDTINIYGGTITAWSNDHGAGIGSGAADESGHSEVKKLTFRQAVVTATGRGGSGIGSGTALGGVSTVEELVVQGGFFKLTGWKNGAGIGSGEVSPDHGGNSHIGRLELWNGTFDVAGFVGIGATRGGSVGYLQLAQGTASHTDITCSAQQHFCFSATMMTLGEGHATVTTNTSLLIDPLDVGGAQLRQPGQFIGLYRSRSDKERITGSPMLHLADVRLDPEPYNLLITEPGGHRLTVPFPPSVKGLLVNVPYPGDYVIEAKTLIGDVSHGNLCHNKGKKTFPVGGSEDVFTDVGRCDSPEQAQVGLTAGQKAGISIGVIVLVAAVAVLLVYFLILRKPSDGGYQLASAAGETAAYTEQA
jgi:hypothetical protein